MKILRITLLALIISSCGSKTMNKIMKSKDSGYKLRMAEQFYVKKKFNKAQILYEDIIPYYKLDKQFEDIYYKYAYCSWYMHDYELAENLFKNFLEVFPNSARAEEVDYMRALSFWKQSPKPELDQTNTTKAMGMMQIFINTHPGSARIKDATAIIDEGRAKLEIKDYKSAKLYYDLGQFRAAGVAFLSVLNKYPESMKADEYKIMAIRSFYKFAELSVEEKKAERYEQVIAECTEFVDRYPESSLRKEAEDYLGLSQSNVKKYSL